MRRAQLPPSAADVPDEFFTVGYSGTFHFRFPADPDVVGIAAQRAPCILPDGGWLLLSADRQAGTVTVVREDAGAMADIYAVIDSRR